jgi:hypothetical protein
MANFNVGDRVRVIDQNITGTVVFADDWHIVIEDDDSEFEDNRLEYRASDLELLPEGVLYFALNANDGLLYNLGKHEDFNSASALADEKKLDAIWLVDVDEAKRWADFINDQLR